MLLVTTVVTIAAFPLVPLLIVLAGSWLLLLVGLLVELRGWRGRPPRSRPLVVAVLTVTLAIVSALLALGLFILAAGPWPARMAVHL